MKKILSLTFIITFAISCNNTGNSNTTKQDEPKKDVMDGHDMTMAKMTKLSAAQKQVQQALDSINTLPEKSKKAAVDYTIRLDTLSGKLKFADSIMNKWMTEFNYDTATTGSNRTEYLESENQKISSVKEAILSALQKADSLFKKP